MDQPNNKKESVIKRMGRGFKVMYEKIVNSNYVQNIKAEQESTVDKDKFMPKDLIEKQDKEVKKGTKNPYATDFNDPFGSVDF